MKSFIRNFISKSKLLKKVYIIFSYYKWKIIYGIKLAIPILCYRFFHKKCIFLIFTPEHANLGDHAIAFSEKRIFNSLGIKYYEITGKQLFDLDYYGYFRILDNSIIFVNGGGNLGDLWPNIEKMNRDIINKLMNSTICFFPNSIYYNKNNKEINFQDSVNIYNNHPNLYLYAREKLSYDIMNKYYKNVKLIPDMVLSLNECNSYDREGCIICLRDDVEKTISKENEYILKNKLENLFRNLKYRNTVIDHNVSTKNREFELKKIFDDFCKSELVVTDRLHGMIFAAITGTKCIVVNSRSPKIKGCYEWIKELGYIKIVDDMKNFDEVYNSLKDYPITYTSNNLSNYYKLLQLDILSLIENGHWIEREI